MDIDKILGDLAKLGIYVNKDKVYAMKYTMYDDGTELYIIFFDRYKGSPSPTSQGIHIPHNLQEEKTSRITSFYTFQTYYSVTLPQDVAPTTQSKNTFFIPLLY